VLQPLSIDLVSIIPGDNTPLKVFGGLTDEDQLQQAHDLSLRVIVIRRG
jgi:hypothetical protein